VREAQGCRDGPHEIEDELGVQFDTVMPLSESNPNFHDGFLRAVEQL